MNGGTKQTESDESTSTVDASVNENPRVPVVGIGASAGGLEAFTQMLQHLPADTGRAFVMIQHLDPHHQSSLSQLLGRATTMPVVEVQDNQRVEANHVYVIAPNGSLTISNGVLKVGPREDDHGHPTVVDAFLESLGHDQHEQAMGVVLSGTGADGTVGLQRIKAEGGITFAQDESAKYDSMPQSAVAAGCVDHVLSPARMSEEIARIAKLPVAPQESSDTSASDCGASDSGAPDEEQDGKADRPLEEDYREILVQLRNRSGVDFSRYRSSTVRRSIGRRSAVTKRSSPKEYLAYLAEDPDELDVLYSDLLIHVTSFFRNSGAFESLKTKVFPKLLEGHGRDETVRMWVPGCSTGQEAFSIAMAFAEVCESKTNIPKLQVFATDLNEAVLEFARQAKYGKGTSKEMSPDRLSRFFVEDEDGYRVRKSIRDQVIFARQNVLNDPPFSHMDLISCRNVLIYFQPELQLAVIPAFHYALNPDGFLFMGESESIGQFSHLFEPVDKGFKLFSKKPAPSHVSLPPTKRDARPPVENAPPASTVLARGSSSAPTKEADVQREADQVSVSDFAPPGVIIDDAYRIVQFRGTTSDYLEPPKGKPTFDVLKMARQGLMLPLRTALLKAKKENARVSRESIPFDESDPSRTVNLHVIPLNGTAQLHFLVLFEASGSGRLSQRSMVARPARSHSKRAEAIRISELEQELFEVRDYLQSIGEENEATTAKLQSSVEETQAANEELQSMNEELETSKEELESSNEELTTLNEEVANRNLELNRLNADLYNFQVSIQTAFLLFGRDLKLRRFTPQAERLFNLLPTDIGRALRDVRHTLEFPDLETFLVEVIESVTMREREVRDREGRWFMFRARPYLTLDSKVDGVVIVLSDIDALKHSEQEISAARDYAQAILRTTRDALIVLDSSLRVEQANEAFYEFFGITVEHAVGRSVLEIGAGQLNKPALQRMLSDLIPSDRPFVDFAITDDFPGRGVRNVAVTARRVLNSDGASDRILVVVADVTERQRAEAAVRQSEMRFRRLFEASIEGVLLINPLDQKITDANASILHMLGYTREECLRKRLMDIGILSDPSAYESVFEELTRTSQVRQDDTTALTKRGKTLHIGLTANLYDEDGRPTIRCNIRDISERILAEEALRETDAQLRKLSATLEDRVEERNAELLSTNEQLNGFTYSVAHDLRQYVRGINMHASVVLADAVAMLDSKSQEHLHRLVQTSNELGTFVDELLGYARLGRQEPIRAAVSLSELVTDAVKKFKNEDLCNSTVEFVIAPDLEAVGDRTMLRVVVENLIDNACKYSSKSPNPLIEFGKDATGFFVRDNGAGFDMAYAGKLFLPFERLHRRADYPGLGIGLANVKRIIDKHGGRVWADSTPDHGATFHFVI